MNHHYALELTWTGNTGTGTSSYRGYERAHIVSAAGVPDILGSADHTFHGDASRWNPELLLVAAVAECHLLTYLHLALNAGIVVTAYEDSPEGDMTSHADGSGEITAVHLHPRMTITDASRIEDAVALHDRVGDLCFIARSVSFPIGHDVEVVAAPLEP